jgi:His-Xaa-Ser system radical SAM maturase HxsC
MIVLRAKTTHSRIVRGHERHVWRLVDPDSVGESAAQGQPNACLLRAGRVVPPGFDLYVGLPGVELDDDTINWVVLPEELDYVRAGDVISVSHDGARVHVLWRTASQQNSILLTERCDHYCLMCSQPPRRVMDDWLLAQAVEVVQLLPSDTRQIGFTGGEPTVYGEDLFRLLRRCGEVAPVAGVHVLSNGRRFHDLDFALGWAAVENPNLMVGIPLYGAEQTLHDYVVQARGAFGETVRGILNLGRLDQRIEIRVVIHKQTAPYLPEIADFIARNLPFVEQVALMGLEMIGLARANVEDVWIDPVEYRDELREAVALLARRQIKTLVYNHQLCLLDDRVWPYAVKSISDWKNEYHPECDSCSMRQRCGGFFFSSSFRTSDHIRAITAEQRVA